MATQAPTPTSLVELSAVDRAVVEVASVFHTPATRSDIARALGHLGHRIAGVAPGPKNLLPILERLTNDGYLEGNEHWRVAPGLAHGVMRQAATLAALAAAVRSVRPVPHHLGVPRYRSWDDYVRELRIELYTGNWPAVRKLVDGAAANAFGQIIRPFDAAWVAEFPPDLGPRALTAVLDEALRELAPSGEALAMLEREPRRSDAAQHRLVEQLVLRGRIADAERLLDGSNAIQAVASRPWFVALRGEWRPAIDAYRSAHRAFLKHCGKRAKFFPDIGGLFYIVALLASGRPDDLAAAATLATQAHAPGISSFPQAHMALAQAADSLSGMVDVTERGTLKQLFVPKHPIERLFGAAATLWVGKALSAAEITWLTDAATRADAAGFSWLAAQYAGLLLRAGVADDAGRLAALRDGGNGTYLAGAVVRQPRWEAALDALSRLTDGASASSVPTHRRRLVWQLTVHGKWLDLEPREQVYSKRGWSAGRPVALKRLRQDASTLAHLTAADRLVCAAIEENVSGGYYRDASYDLDTGKALHALVGEPNVVTEIGGELVPVQVRERPPRLRVSAVPATGGFRLALDPPPPRNTSVSTLALLADSTTVEVVTLREQHHTLGRSLGPDGLEVPAEGETRLREVVAALSSLVVVDAELPAGGGAHAADAPADPTPRFVLRPFGEGLSVEPIVRPLGARGPTASPGRGGATFFAEVDGHRRAAQRDPDEESRRVAGVLSACPVLGRSEQAGAGRVLPDRDAALEALSELQAACAADQLEWPDGGVIAVSAPVSLGQLAISLRGKGDRFQVTGKLAGPDGKPIDLEAVLDYVAASPGRFLRIAGHPELLALTLDLRLRLEELRALAEPGKKLQFHRLLVPRVEELLEAARVKADAAWKRQRERLTVATADPEVPSTFRGELRPYQLDGFHWLARLGRWGAGGCLADDMGLGKTVQAIALLLLRAPEGPSLVVAPTSVLPTWQDEIARFAPTLRVKPYVGPQRPALLADLGPHDIVLTSYALLQQDAAALAGIHFTVALLDEAQAIKNSETLRARAAYQLDAEQKIATTGTPIENRLDELWSLFRFLCPGLLGTAKSFDARFGRPITEARDPVARARLQRLISPFLLRRTKTDVVPELPSRSEITLRVDMFDEELALYEVLRQEAVDKLGDAVDDRRRTVHLLAAITRLRRAASNARLVLPDRPLPSAKLEAFTELLDELLPSGHKLLVFSQFVDHLSLVREVLDARGVSYQYLDGSTPLARRKRAIDAFQAGASELFLISLKAGGFGLNLTAADYVVHLDPWWNPAAEDQASDRAHRIGQTRPVTIYRLVARDTIEDRIVDLHHRKRHLAASVLEGSDVAAQLSQDELLELLRAAT